VAVLVADRVQYYETICGGAGAGLGTSWAGGMVETQGTTIETSDVLRMFPTFVWKAEVAPGVRLGIENDVLGILDEMRGAAAEPAPGRGWQSERAIITRFLKVCRLLLTF
jgi:hypothetical protein